MSKQINKKTQPIHLIQGQICWDVSLHYACGIKCQHLQPSSTTTHNHCTALFQNGSMPQAVLVPPTQVGSQQKRIHPRSLT